MTLGAHTRCRPACLGRSINRSKGARRARRGVLFLARPARSDPEAVSGLGLPAVHGPGARQGFCLLSVCSTESTLEIDKLIYVTQPLVVECCMDLWRPELDSTFALVHTPVVPKKDRSYGTLSQSTLNPAPTDGLAIKSDGRRAFCCRFCKIGGLDTRRGRESLARPAFRGAMSHTSSQSAARYIGTTDINKSVQTEA